MQKGISGLIAVMVLAGCANTKMTSFSDPSFKGTEFRNLVVHSGGNFETQQLITSEVCKVLSSPSVRCATSLELFSPTRTYTNEEISETLRSRSVDGYMSIIIGSDSSSSQHIGSQSFGTVNVYGNSASANSSTFSAYSYSRQQGFDIVLIDTATLQNAWVGGARVSGQGLLNVTDEVFASSLASELADALKKAGHLRASQ